MGKSEIAGYLIPGEIVQAEEVATVAESTSTEERTTVIEQKPTEVTQPPRIEAPVLVSVPEPVRA